MNVESCELVVSKIVRYSFKENKKGPKIKKILEESSSTTDINFMENLRSRFMRNTLSRVESNLEQIEDIPFSINSALPNPTLTLIIYIRYPDNSLKVTPIWDNKVGFHKETWDNYSKDYQIVLTKKVRAKSAVVLI